MSLHTPDTQPTQTGQIAAGDLAMGTVVANRFRIESLLGIGGMGMVYRATDLALDVPIAIKLLRVELASKPGAFERFRQELLLSRQVSSPQVVRIHDLAEHAGRWFITMDLVEGESLDKVIDRRGAMPIDEAVGIARQIAQGLAAAHGRDIVHRDLKPANILIDVRGDAVITDFGIARSLGVSGITHTGAVVGTPDYLSPEQARGGAIDGRSDLYALGLVLYEMLSGRPAFAGCTSAESLSRRLLGPPPPIKTLRADVPPWLQRLLERLLQPQPARRLVDAEAVIKAIDHRQVPRDLRPRARILWALGLVLVAAALAMLWIARDPTLTPVMPTFELPDRLVLAPTAHAGLSGRDADAVRAIDHHLRQGLDSLPDLIVVDSARTLQAARQLGLREGQTVVTEALLKLVPARREMQLRVTRNDEGLAWRIPGDTANAPASASINGNSLIPPISLADGAGGAASRVARASGSKHPFPDSLWPDDDAALVAMGQGLRARSVGRLDLATAAFAKAVTADPGYAAAWLELAEMATLAGQLEQASAAIERGLAASPTVYIAERLRQLQVSSTGDADAALVALRARLKGEPDDLDAQRRLGMLLGEAGEHAESILQLRKLVARDEGDARAWFLLGKNAILHGDLRVAVDEYLVRALLLYRRGGDAFGQAETVNALGVGYARLGQTVEATRQYRDALELRRALGNLRGVASSLRNLAQLAMVRGDFDEARGQLDEARELFTEIGDRSGLAAVDNELGLLAEEQGDYSAALIAYRRALQSREAAGDAHAIAESLNNIGFAHFQLGAYDSAQAFWRQALDAFTKADDPSGVVRAQQNLGLLATARGKWTEAKQFLDTSLASAERQQMLEESAVSRRNLAELALWRGELADAARLAGIADEQFAEREDQRGLADIALLRARIALVARDTATATRALREADKAFAASSTEQRAQQHLLDAEIALIRGQPDVARRNADEAATLGGKSGVMAIELQSEAMQLALGGGAIDALLPKLTLLGNVNVQMESLVRLLRARTAARDWTLSATIGRELLALVALIGPHALAGDVHRLRALAFAGLGDATAETEARALAQSASDRLVEHADAAQRASLAADPALHPTGNR